MGTDEVIALALLLGSDYTEGVRGVGIVNAMEVRREGDEMCPLLSSADKYRRSWRGLVCIRAKRRFVFPHFHGNHFFGVAFFLSTV